MKSTKSSSCNEWALDRKTMTWNFNYAKNLVMATLCKAWTLAKKVACVWCSKASEQSIGSKVSIIFCAWSLQHTFLSEIKYSNWMRCLCGSWKSFIKWCTALTTSWAIAYFADFCRNLCSVLKGQSCWQFVGYFQTHCYILVANLHDLQECQDYWKFLTWVALQIKQIK